MKHYLHKELVAKQIKVVLVGAGGSGSRMLEHLVCLHRAMIALGHPRGLNVLLIDDDVVTNANVGRQAFYPCDIGTYKAMTLINRANMALGDTMWSADVNRLTTKTTGFSDVDLVIGAVDNRAARLATGVRCVRCCGQGVGQLGVGVSRMGAVSPKQDACLY